MGCENKKHEEFEDIYEDVIIYYGFPIIITDVLVRKHKSTGIKFYINHPESIYKIERVLNANAEKN